jgi:NTP pyrophosphatase (non-canonical NTP hydrolase)
MGMSEYTFNQYQKETAKTAIYPEHGTQSFAALVYVVLGLANEAGEVAGKLKKIIRDKKGNLSDEDVKTLMAESSDVLWYSSQLATELDLNLGEIAQYNIAKLTSRLERGVIGGSGDNR